MGQRSKEFADCTEHPGVPQHGVHWLLMCSEDHTPATTLILSRPPLWSQSLSTADRTGSSTSVLLKDGAWQMGELLWALRLLAEFSSCNCRPGVYFLANCCPEVTVSRLHIHPKFIGIHRISYTLTLSE